MTARVPASMPIGTVLHAQQQRTGSDCTVAAIATLTGIAYELVLTAFARIAPMTVVDGATWADVRRVLKLLGLRSTRKHRIDWDEDVGLLRCLCGDRHAYHAVVLAEGRILDMDGRNWPADIWIATVGATECSLLIVREHETA